MALYYTHPPASYYAIADKAPHQYTPEVLPFHCDLANRVTAGMQIFEFGCGTAHLCPVVVSNGGIYTGMDYSDDLLNRNRLRFPYATFLSIKSPVTDQFDLVASLYTIEHVIDPLDYLNRMWRLCKPSGLIAIICPEFIDNEALPPSLFYGRTPRRFREKMRSLDLLDAFSHLVDLRKARRWKTEAQRGNPGAFWMNARPSELYGAAHGVDTDAIHFPRLSDLRAWFVRLGAEVLVTSQSMPGIPREVLAYNCYIVVKKL